jgi:hypothetical protein
MGRGEGGRGWEGRKGGGVRKEMMKERRRRYPAQENFDGNLAFLHLIFETSPINAISSSYLLLGVLVQPILGI